MKKYMTIAALLVAGTAFANAATTIIPDISESWKNGDETISWDSATKTLSGSGTWQIGGRDVAQTGISFTLNLTAAQKVSGDVELVAVDANAGDISLFLTTSGIRGGWSGAVWNNSPTVSYSDLLSKDSVITAKDGNKYLTLTMTIADIQGAQGGTQLYSTDSSTSLLGSATVGLGSTSNTSISGIKFDTDYISYLAITPGWVNGNTAVAVGTELNNVAKNALIVPEPSAFGLLAGMGALALVASRRRRK